MSRTIPPLLSPYLSLPSESSLILLTSVLGAGTNWLVLRYLSSLLSPSSSQTNVNHNIDVDDENNDEDVKVVFLSFMRDMAFWREGGRKINLDLDRLTQNNRFHFIDGLTSLHLPQTQPTTPTPIPGTCTILKDPSLQTISSILSQTITSLSSQPQPQNPTQTPKIILLIDALDFLLASASPTNSQNTTQQLTTLLLQTREKVHATILTLSIDTPLLSPTPLSSPLSTHSSHFLLTLAHTATLILSTRLLDTGAARDVSGVLRITRPSGGNAEAETGEDARVHDGMMEEKELLYLVGGDGDGSVRVFERGQ